MPQDTANSPLEYGRDGTLIRGADGNLYFIPGDFEVFRVDGDESIAIDKAVLAEMDKVGTKGRGDIENDLRVSKTTVAQLRKVKRSLPEGSEGSEGDLRMTKTTFFDPQ
jgi:hypothetical protein